MTVIQIFMLLVTEKTEVTGKESRVFFLINDYIQNGSFDYKSNINIEASHEASSGDLDGDGDLDIFFCRSNDVFQSMDAGLQK